MQADRYAEYRRILRRQDVERLTGLSYTTIWRKEHAGDFPQRVRLGANAVGWREGDVLRWIDARETVSGAA